MAVTYPFIKPILPSLKLIARPIRKQEKFLRFLKTTEFIELSCEQNSKS